MRWLSLPLLLLLSLTARAELVVVVGKDSPVEQLARSEVANIFLAKTNRLANGSRIQPLELSDEKVKAVFYQMISGKTLPQINAYWTTLIFTGKGRPPKNIDQASRLIEKLENDPRAISYLPQEKVNESMRVVHTFH